MEESLVTPLRNSTAITNATGCAFGKSSAAKELEEATGVLYPFELEFCLAGVELLLGLAKLGE